MHSEKPRIDRCRAFFTLISGVACPRPGKGVNCLHPGYLPEKGEAGKSVGVAGIKRGFTRFVFAHEAHGVQHTAKKSGC